MPNIAEIDPNFRIETNIKQPGIRFYNPEEAPFRIYGVYREGERFTRLPNAVARATSEGVTALSTNTAGGRVRFRTNSPYVAIHAEMDGVGVMSHFAFVGSAGFDLYIKGPHNAIRFCNSWQPPYGMREGYEGLHYIGDGSVELDVTIHFPLYSNVKRLAIGLDEKAVVSQAEDYAIEQPVVYYGSSITQGGCASRPGMAYQNILSRRLNVNHVNLGFSGNARGEQAMVEYIAGLEMSAFVLDYDHNAPNVAHLQATHEPMFRAIRAAHPDLPILMMTRPLYRYTPDDMARLEVVRTTYLHALADGDKNAWFIDGRELMSAEYLLDEGTVDGCHPTDAGFASMARRIHPVLAEMLGLK